MAVAKMVEASPVKFYLAKFFFLGISLVQWLVATTILFRFGIDNKNLSVALIFVAFGLIFFFIFLVINEKIKRVAVGKNKIVIIDGDRNMRFDWPEVKSLKLTYFNLYKLKIKGKRNTIYFFPSKNIDPAFGLLAKDTSRMGNIVEKKKKDFGIK